MPRPRKCRKVCCLPPIKEFRPIQSSLKGDAEIVILAVDEYEAIRLIDYEGLGQEECSQHMNIARTTVQLIYTRARKKIARALVNGFSIRIEGGDYKLCGGKEVQDDYPVCPKHKRREKCYENRSCK